jgi:hypothetical protein
MLTAALVVFVVALFGLVGLFTLKFLELERNYTIAPGARVWADERALKFKEFLGRSHFEFSKVVPAFIFLLRLGVHELALLFAAFARIMERQAHRIADMVSHKHRFERRESRSEFLKKVGDYKSTGQSTESEENSEGK